ncbi:LysR family transcriptional regulator [Candidatus Finniella inopinata]|uniref:LysR family transcriptional regulator n=1 Tax=Candidatus Finniella inopinata TaxID=1696036 RepID=A0A4Q7DM65_9PROT|nr:LysR family transcriptional regulator [Candidatus Finniella inopinata]RZI45876.1 LysR family transcriptional regulator [Candidatus Finniella inopinata]
MDWDKLRAFHVVARCGSFAKAAQEFHLSPSAVSRQIADIEHSLGVSLFNRHPRGLTLTGSGEILFQNTAEVLEKLRETEMLLKSDRNEAKGLLRVATTFALSNSWLTRYLKNFFDLYPDIQLTIIGNDDELDLQIRQADVAIRTALPHQPELVQIYLTTFHLRLYASREYLDKFGIPKEPEDLSQHRLLVYGDDAPNPFGNINWLLHFGLQKNQPPRTPFLRINSAYGLTRCVEAGLGIAAISKEYAIAETTDLVVLPNFIGPSVKIYYVYPKSLQKFKRVTVLGDFLRETLEKENAEQNSNS